MQLICRICILMRMKGMSAQEIIMDGRHVLFIVCVHFLPENVFGHFGMSQMLIGPPQGMTLIMCAISFIKSNLVLRPLTRLISLVQIILFVKCFIFNRTK